MANIMHFLINTYAGYAVNEGIVWRGMSSKIYYILLILWAIHL